MIYVPDPVELKPDTIQVGDIMTYDPPGLGIEPRQLVVYYIGEYPPPHFEAEGWDPSEDSFGVPILGMYDTGGNGYWLGQAKAYDHRELFRKPRVR